MSGQHSARGDLQHSARGDLPHSARDNSERTHEIEQLRANLVSVRQQLLEAEEERDLIQIESINKKEYYESILRTIREQINDKENKYSQLYKSMNENIQGL